MKCWSCQIEVSEREPFCSSCKKIQPLPMQSDYFFALGLPRKFALDLPDLERRFRERSRLLHPDRFARADPKEKRVSLERATQLNDAYRALKDERSRAEYLLRLSGHDAVAESATLHDPEFLEEQLEIREALEEAKAAGDDATRRQIAEDTRDKLAQLFTDVRALFAEPEEGGGGGESGASEGRLADVARLVARARYFDNIIAEVENGSSQ